jgi:hypothetical protein
MFTLPEIENETNHAQRLPAPAPAAPGAAPAPAQPPRLHAWLDAFFRHAGAIAVDHTHLLPLARISGRTGVYTPVAKVRGCC